jgi:hypothetical protein
MIPSYLVVASIGLWLVIAIWGLGLIAVVSLNYWPGYIAMLATLVGGAVSNSPLILFAPAFCLVFMFVIGTSSIARHWGVVTYLISGTSENISQLYSSCIRRFAKVFLFVTVVGLAFSLSYAVLPTLAPTPADPTTLAVYVGIALIAIAIILRLASN